MHRILKTISIEFVSLYLTTLVASGMVFQFGLRSMLLTAAALAVTNVLVKPVINILLLPFNLITFNLFRFVHTAITLLIVDILLVEFSVKAFLFLGLPWDTELLPHVSFAPGLLSYVGFAFVISSISSFLFWLLK